MDEAQRKAAAEFETARAGEGETMGKVAQLMLDRVIPETAK